MLRLSAIPRLLSLALLAAALTGCGAGGSTPAPDDLVGTMVAGTYQAMTAAAPPIPQATMTLEPPTSIPSPTAAPATRINFATGSTYGYIQVSLQPGQSQAYVLGAMQGQPMIVRVDSAYSDGILAIRGADNAQLLSETLRYNSWWGILPSAQNYIVTVTAGAAGGSYTLGVTIASRIQFPAGENGTTVTGTTVGGYNISYAVWASTGQTMTVNLDVPGGAASLEIWGFDDGELYVGRQDGWTSFSITLPAAQEFIVEVYPSAGQEVYYTLSVDVH
jgi:hypothetical protein